MQENSEDRGEYHGTGLGMAIVKNLIDQMKGTIEISSKKGVGTTFIITIPFEIAKKLERDLNLEEEANAFKEDEQKCIDAGMNAHLVKPLHIKKVVSTIARLCRKVNNSDYRG